jgi:hypothetical protein
MNRTVIFPFLILSILGANVFLVPCLTPRRLFFTITVPDGFPVSEASHSIIRGYHMQVAALIVASALVAVAIPRVALGGAVASGIGRRGGLPLCAQ